MDKVAHKIALALKAKNIDAKIYSLDEGKAPAAIFDDRYHRILVLIPKEVSQA